MKEYFIVVSKDDIRKNAEQIKIGDKKEIDSIIKYCYKVWEVEKNVVYCHFT